MGTPETAHERAAIITFELMTYGQITAQRARELTGLSKTGAYYVLVALSRILPIRYDHDLQLWIFSGDKITQGANE